MANGRNGRNGKHNTEDAVAFSNIFDFEDPMLGERYTKRKEPVVSTKETRQGKSVDAIVPDQRNRGWMQGWEKARKRVATSPVSFHQDELLPMMKGIFDSADSLEQPFRDKDGDLFGGMGVSRKGPQYGLPLDVRMSTLLGDVKRGDDIIDCYVRGLETPTRRKTYALQQPPHRSFGLGGETRDQKRAIDKIMDMASAMSGKDTSYQTGKDGRYADSSRRDAAAKLNPGSGGIPTGGVGYPTDKAFVGAGDAYRWSLSEEDARAKNQIYPERKYPVNGVSGSTGRWFWKDKGGNKYFVSR